MVTTGLTRRRYAFIGKLFIQKEPEIANRLLSAYLPDVEPMEKDFSHIKGYLKTFCEHEGIDHDGFLKVDTKRKFIAVILHLYAPQVFLHTTDNFIITRGLAKELSKVFRQTNALMSIRIREVIVWEKSYEDFRQEVEAMVEKITREKLNQFPENKAAS